MRIFENHRYIENDEYAICYFMGTYQVWNLTEYELFENTTPIFTGNFVECSQFLDELEIKHRESLF